MVFWGEWWDRVIEIGMIEGKRGWREIKP